MAIVAGRRAKGLEPVVLVLHHTADLLVAETTDALDLQGAAASSLGQLQQRRANHVLFVGWHMKGERRALNRFQVQVALCALLSHSQHLKRPYLVARGMWDNGVQYSLKGFQGNKLVRALAAETPVLLVLDEVKLTQVAGFLQRQKPWAENIDASTK